MKEKKKKLKKMKRSKSNKITIKKKLKGPKKLSSMRRI